MADVFEDSERTLKMHNGAPRIFMRRQASQNACGFGNNVEWRVRNGFDCFR